MLGELILFLCVYAIIAVFAFAVALGVLMYYTIQPIPSEELDVSMFIQFEQFLNDSPSALFKTSLCCGICLLYIGFPFYLSVIGYQRLWYHVQRMKRRIWPPQTEEEQYPLEPTAPDESMLEIPYNPWQDEGDMWPSIVEEP